MSSPHVRAARRNAYVLGATGLTVGLLFLFPTSTNRTTHVGRRAVARTGVVGGAAVRTVNGRPVATQFGPIQVRIQLRGTRIVSAVAVVYPRDTSEDQQINAMAIPQLQKETLAAQSAHVETVSGATYTSQGYAGSLQSALDAARR